MCGIVGYIGSGRHVSKIVEKLKKLEYRGYDSAGIFFKNQLKNSIIKSVGNIDKLKEKISNEFKTSLSIAHTRWATHGEPNIENCHPQISHNGKWIIVHNGIIENYIQLKSELSSQPKSQTDTAVISQLLEEKNVNQIDEFIDCFKNIEGSYAILACNSLKDRIFVAKNKSPLYIAKVSDGFVCASDPICFSDETDKYFSLEDGEFAEISVDYLYIFNKSKKILQKCAKNIEKISNINYDNKYQHFMLKEIEEQSEVVKNLVKMYKSNIIIHKLNNFDLKNIDYIKIIGCGTAYHSGLLGARYFEKICNIKSDAEIASEFLYKQPKFINEKTLVIAISQSGETADTLKALELARKYKAKTLALTNVEYSTIVSKSDEYLPICAGPEKAVASTKAYTCQLCVLYLLANYLVGELKYLKALNDINKLSKLMLNFDKEQIENIALKIKDKNSCIFIGKDFDCVTAAEASLKLTEVAYINCSYYPSGELKHGYLALVEKGTPIFVFATQSKINQKTFNSAKEAESRGAMQFIISNEKNLQKSANIIKINCNNVFLLPILSIIPMQYLAYRVSVLKNINPDQPRNLAKSVTVE